MAYTDYETYSALSPAECAAAFQEGVDNTTYATYAILLFTFKQYLSSIPAVGTLLVFLVNVTLTPERTGSLFDLGVSSMDAYFRCAIGEEGFT